MPSSLNLEPVRVLAVILDDTTYPDLFKKYGEWASIGGIVWEYVKNPTTDKSLYTKNFALPLSPNIKHIPVENEIVLLVISSDSGVLNDVTSYQYYYLPPTNVWASSHHNATPDQIYSNPGVNTLPGSQKQDYTLVGGTLVRRVNDEGTEIFKPGDPFVENRYIRTLAPYPGDVLVEGRYGNSLRFSSTSKFGLKNNWSNYEAFNAPITILRNGQKIDFKQDPWVNIAEDINVDFSSIYLTSNQQIQLIPSSFSTAGYKVNQYTPKSISSYTDPQIILSSNRLVFNSKSDSIILSAAKGVLLSTNNSINLDTKLTTIRSQEINLGASDAKERAVKGDTFVKELSSFLIALKQVQVALSTAVNSGGPVQSLIDVSATFGSAIDNLQKALGGKTSPNGDITNSKVLSDIVKLQ
jgi:hypothetical protein